MMAMHAGMNTILAYLEAEVLLVTGKALNLRAQHGFISILFRVILYFTLY